jgi:guanylate kinase
LKKYFGERGLSLFIRVKDLNELEKRLRLRGTENEQSLQKRINKAKFEMNFESSFDRVVINDILEDTQDEAERIVREFLNS